VAATYAGGIPFLLLVLLLVIRGQWEVLRLFQPDDPMMALRLVAIAAGLALVVDASLSAGIHWSWLLLAGTGLVFAVALTGGPDRPVMEGVGGAAVSWLYVAIPLSHLLWLREAPAGGEAGASGPWVVITLWLVVWAFDTFAYFAGKAWGRHKIVPSISPGKSWEGTAAGLVAAMVVGVALALLVDDLGWRPVSGLALGLILGLGAFLGDLIESRLKRSVGRKDAGGLLLGHGGVLDRFDSTLVCAPAFYYLLLLFGQIPMG
jgi:phosphatidate cytidylyltransferase